MGETSREELEAQLAEMQRQMAAARKAIFEAVSLQRKRSQP